MLTREFMTLITNFCCQRDAAMKELLPSAEDIIGINKLNR